MDAPQERWSAEDLRVATRPDMPVYVLTSRRNTVRCTFAPAGIEMTLRLEQDDEVLVGTYGQEDDEQSLRLERR